MLVRGLLVAFAGFLFIFIPGLPMRLLARPDRTVPRGLLYWGMLIWVVTLLVGLFFQSLMSQAFQPEGPRAIGGRPGDLVLALIGALLQAFLLEVGMYWRLRRTRAAAVDRESAGLTLGYGVGIIYQVFTGFALVGAGVRLVFGDSGDATLAALAASPMLELVLGLTAMVLFRLALLVVRGALGVLVGEAADGRSHLLWWAVGLDAAFVWLILVLQVLVGGGRPGQIMVGQVDPVTSAVSVVYYLVVFLVAYQWLKARRLLPSPAQTTVMRGDGVGTTPVRKR